MLACMSAARFKKRGPATGGTRSCYLWEYNLICKSDSIVISRTRRKLKSKSRSNDIFLERVILTRRDGLEFPVARSSGRMLQLAYLNNGMEMIWVVKLLQKSGETKIRAQYYRVL